MSRKEGMLKEKRINNKAIIAGILICLLALFLQFSMPPVQAAAETIWQEDFESLPRMNETGSDWACGDNNVSGGLAYWGEVNWTGSNHTTGGSWGAWCAAVGGNLVTHKYVNNMSAYARRTVDLTSYENASVSFWYIIPSQHAQDGAWFSRNSQSIALSGPTQPPGTWLSLHPTYSDLTCGSTVDLVWWWVSFTYLPVGEGMYIDDISVTGTRAILLNSPNGGEEWAGGSSKNISWTTSAGKAPFKINLYYSTDGGLTYLNQIAQDINQATTGTAQYNWTVPSINSSNVKVKVERVDADGKVRYDESNNKFTIDSTNPVAIPGGPYKVNEGRELTLDGSASYDPQGDPLTYDWDFGDGTAHGSGDKPKHTYAIDGTYRTYEITLIVSDGSSSSTPAKTYVDVCVRGDLDLDGKVDIFDLVIASKAFGTTPPDANWDARADINSDNTVNIFDLVLVAKDFGKTKP